MKSESNSQSKWSRKLQHVFPRSHSTCSYSVSHFIPSQVRVVSYHTKWEHINILIIINKLFNLNYNQAFQKVKIFV